MAIDERLSELVRSALAEAAEVSEVKMFGGIGFMLAGNMVVCADDRGLLVRVGNDGEAEALSRPGSEPMIMSGRKMVGYVRVARDGLDKRNVQSWIRLARRFVETLPPKKVSTKSRAKRGTK
jgi:TfoX/Sxy family transcriptional regulator of competence genes